jgi:hypothetical protein
MEARVSALPATLAAASPDRARRLVRRAAAPLALAALCLLFFAQVLPSGWQFLFRDTGRMHWPVKRWIAEELSRGHFPQWNPYAGAGVPLVAGAVDAPLHPFNALLVLLPFDVAFKAWVILSALAAGLGALAWARRLGADPPAALLAGAGFMLSGFVVSSTDNLQYLSAVAAAPWILAAGHAWATHGGPGRLALAAVASFVGAAAGDPMGWGMAVALAAAQALLVAPAGRDRPRRAALLGLASAAAAAPVLLPVLLWIPHSSRAGAVPANELAAWNLAPTRLLELAVPRLTEGPLGDVYDAVYEAVAPGDPKRRPWVISVYAGAPVIALAALAAARARAGRILVAGAAVTAWMAMGPNAGFGAVAARLPVLGQLRYWEKLACWPALLLAAAAALGASALLTDARAARRAAVGAAAGAVAFLLLASVALLASQAVGGALGPGARGPGVREALAENLRSGALHAAAALLATALVAVGAGWGRGERIRRALPLALSAVVGADLWIANVDAWVLSPAATMEVGSPVVQAARRSGPWPRVQRPWEPPDHRFPGLTIFESKWRVGSRVMSAAWNVPERIGSADAYTGMIPGRLRAVREGLTSAELVRAEANLGFYLLNAPANPAALSSLGLAPPLEVIQADAELGTWLVRIPHRPRAWVGRGVAVPDPGAALAFVGREPIDSGRAAVEGPVPEVQSFGGTARIVADEGERVALDVAVPAAAPALLVLADQEAPGWTAEVDGAPAEIVRANFLARGVWIPPGRHAVLFRYRTPGLLEGLAIAASLAAALAAASLVERRGGWSALTSRRASPPRS